MGRRLLLPRTDHTLASPAPARAGLPPHSTKAVIDKQFRAVTAAVGRAHGFDYAEGFRVSRFGAIPRLAKGQELEEDV